eukprot:5431780-Pleurochrysis_carterae.AAC.1
MPLASVALYFRELRVANAQDAKASVLVVTVAVVVELDWREEIGSLRKLGKTEQLVRLVLLVQMVQHLRGQMQKSIRESCCD